MTFKAFGLEQGKLYRVAKRARHSRYEGWKNLLSTPGLQFLESVWDEERQKDYPGLHREIIDDGEVVLFLGELAYLGPRGTADKNILYLQFLMSDGSKRFLLANRADQLEKM